MKEGQGLELSISKMETPKLNELQLSHLNVFSEKEGCDDFDEFKFEFNNVKLKLFVDRIVEHEMCAYCLEISEYPFWIVKASFSFNMEKNEPIIESKLEKNAGFRDKKELGGIGIVLFGKILELFQYLADSRDKKFKHIVKKIPDFKKGYKESDIVMNEIQMSEKWDEIFVEFLTQHSYESDSSGDLWVKEYLPRKK